MTRLYEFLLSFLAFCAILVIIAVYPTQAFAAELPQITVGPQGDYADIATALSDAQPGQNIMVQPGIYHERIVIDKPVKLTGQQGVTIDGDGKENIILINNTHDVIISGLTLQNSGGPALTPYAGVKIVESQRVTVTDNTLKNVEHGVYLEKSQNCTIQQNSISGKVDLLPEDRGDGIGLWRSDHNVIAKNHVWNVRDGAKFEFSTFNQVSENHFDHLRYGLHYMYSNDNNFDHNLFKDDVAGATPMYSQRINFTNNVFMHLPGERAYAILLQDSDDCVIKNNLVFESNVAFHFDHSNRNLVEGNTIINSGVAFRIFGTSTDNTFTQNNLQNNVVQVSSDYQALPNQWSFNGTGNYWDDYQGYDFSASGIGARSYESINYLSQAVYDQPMLELFANSPGLKALGQGMQLFPLFNLPSIRDEYPLMHPPQMQVEWLALLDQESSHGSSLIFGILPVGITLSGLWIFSLGYRRRGKSANHK